MPCYCSQIPRCRQDISTVQNMKYHLQQVDDRNHMLIISGLNQINSTLGSSVLPDNLGAEQTGIAQSNDDLRSKTAALLLSCEEKIRQLEQELASMQASDRSYHASKNKRK